MSSPYVSALFAAAYDSDAGNELAALFAISEADRTSFNTARLARKSNDHAVTCRVQRVAVTASVVAATHEFNGDGPYPILTGAGLTTDRIAYIKTKLVLALGEKVTIDSGFDAWLLSQGLEYVPEAAPPSIT